MFTKLFSITLALLAATSQVAAVPAESLQKRGPGCDGLPGGLSDLSHFRLSASGGSNKGEDLVLFDSGNKVGDANIFVLASRFTVPGFPTAPTFSLNTGALLPDNSNLVDLAVAAGDLPGFAANHGEGNHIYCAVPNGGNSFVLGVNSDKSNFFICNSKTGPFKRFIVYKPDSNHPVYDRNSCQNIQINVIKA